VRGPLFVACRLMRRGGSHGTHTVANEPQVDRSMRRALVRLCYGLFLLFFFVLRVLDARRFTARVAMCCLLVESSDSVSSTAYPVSSREKEARPCDNGLRPRGQAPQASWR
jgi:hypothetical protein